MRSRLRGSSQDELGPLEKRRDRLSMHAISLYSEAYQSASASGSYEPNGIGVARGKILPVIRRAGLGIIGRPVARSAICRTATI